MHSGRNIFVTGAGVISAIGNGKEQTLDSLLSCRCGIAPVQYLDTSLRHLPAGEVKASDMELMRMCGIPAQEAGRFSRAALTAVPALREALSGAGLSGGMTAAVPFISATTVGGMDRTERSYPLDPDGTGYIRYHDCGAVTDATASVCGPFAMQTTVSTACSAALNAIIFACGLIRSGQADIVVAGGTECLTRYHLNGFNSLRILDSRPCRPFDVSRAGLNLGEGAGYVVLESLRSVQARGVQPLAAVAGYANRCDAFHQTASSEDGEGAYLAMTAALKDAALEASDIDYVNAHGTGTPNNDSSEGAALVRVFGKGKVPYVSSTKGFTGHTTSASGAVETVISLLAMQHSFVPASLGFACAPPGLGFTPEASCRTASLDRVMVNSFGFGGNDSCIILENTSR